MEILRTCKFFMQLTNLYNKNGVKVFGYAIPNAIIHFLYVLPMTFCLIWMSIFCYNFNMDLKTTSSAIYLSLGIFSMVSMYLCMAVKNDLIIESTDLLQAMVTKRKL